MSRILLSIGVIQVMIMVVGLVRAKAIALILGPGGVGVASTVDQLVLVFVQLGALSLPFTAMKLMARDHSDGPDVFGTAFTGFLHGLVALAGVTTLAVTLTLWWRPEWLGADLLPHRTAVQIAVLGIPALMLQIFLVNSLAAGQATVAAAWLSFALPLALAVGAIIGAAHAGLPGLYAASVAAGALATGLALWLVRRRLGIRATSRARSVRFLLQRGGETFRISGYVYVTMVTYAVAMLGIRYLVLAELGAEAAGILQGVLALALTAGAILAPMSNLYLAPLVNRSLPATEKIAKAHRFAAKVAVMLIAVCLPHALFPRLALTILFTAEFATGATVLFGFLAWQALYQFVNVYQQLLIGLDDVRFVTLATSASYLLAALLTAVGLPALRLGAPAVGLSAGAMLFGMAATWRLRRRFGGGIPAPLVARMVLALGALAAIGIGLADTSELHPFALTLRLSVGLAVLLMVYLLLDEAERQELKSGWGLLRRQGRS